MEETKQTDTTVMVNFLRQIVPEWSKISTYFVIVIIIWAGWRLMASFETPKEVETHNFIMRSMKTQKHDDSLKIYQLELRFDRWDKKQVIDSVNVAKQISLQRRIAIKLGIIIDKNDL